MTLLARPLVIALALTSALTLTACGGAARVGAASPAASPEQGPHNLRIYDTKGARFVPFSRLADAVNRADVVFLGEQHDDPGTHAAELAVLAALGAGHDRVVLSLEMFERDVQPLLNRYLDGSLSEKDFLADSRPWPRYTTDYRGMVELARIRGWPVIAANVPRRIASAVSRAGLATLDTMNAVERAFSARENQCPKDLYYQKFVATMGDMSASHGGGAPAPVAAAGSAPKPSAAPSIDRIYEAQCIKDETMGESAANALAAAGRGAVVLHVDGAFHSDFGLGTAERVRRRAPSAKTLVLSAVPVADPAAANVAEYATRGDFILFTRAPAKEIAR